MTKAKMRPIRLAPGQKREVRTQFGALCYRLRDGKTEILLVTSRRTGRWIIPKGWPIGGETPADAALQEAWEEAGVIGKLAGNVIGVYSYTKLNDLDRLPCLVAVFPIQVKQLEEKYPESRQRRRKWFSPKKAATRVGEPELKHLLATFDPAALMK